MTPAKRARRTTEHGHSGGGARHGTPRDSELTGSVEDYLKAIYELESHTGPVSSLSRGVP